MQPDFTTTQDRPLIFLHIEKAAGTSLRSVIRRQYGAEYVHDYVQSPTALQEIPSDARAIQGHIQFSFFHAFPAPATWITVLREPVSRVISTYRYCLEPPSSPAGTQNRESYWYQYARTRSLKEFIEDGLYLWGENAQVKFLSGETDVPFGQGTPQLLERARQNLQNHFSFVGLSERFDETVILLRRMLNWRTPYYIRENITRRPLRRDDLSPETLEVVEKYNQLDTQLYREAEAAFNALVEAQDETFTEEVGIFKLLNEHCRPYLDELSNAADFSRTEIRIVQDTVLALQRDNGGREAGKVLRWGLNRYPESIDLQNLMALVQHREGQTEAARASLAALTARHPDHPDAFANLGRMLWESGDLENALQYLATALTLDNYHRPAVLYCGQALTQSDHLDEARQLYSHYLEKNPRDGEMIFLRNNLQWRQP